MRKFDIKKLKCKWCGADTLIKDLRYEKTGTYLICKKCHEQKYGPRISDTFSKASIEENSLEKLHFLCTNCGFKFKRSKNSRVALLCPYCGKDSIQEYRPFDAEFLLEISDD